MSIHGGICEITELKNGMIRVTFFNRKVERAFGCEEYDDWVGDYKDFTKRMMDIARLRQFRYTIQRDEKNGSVYIKEI